MINLIPPEGHKAVKREYILRVGTTHAFLFGSVCVLLIFSLIPTYVLVRAQISASVEETEEIDSGGEALIEADKELKLTQDALTQLKTSKESVTATDAINEIQKLAPAGIEFRTFSMEAPSGIIEKVQVVGNAPTREILAQFSQLIEGSAMFLKSDVPISDLARDVNLPFTIIITLEPPK